MSDYWKKRRDKSADDEFRTAYERDYARVVHSAAFRRLQSKTQVLGVGDSDFYRTRLTHSMEVSQIGEAIARRHEKDLKEDSIHLDPFLIRTICLAHDLGHPPFGHGGEVALNRCMLKHGGFEANGQTLRIVTSIEQYHEKFGMNLSRRSLLGVMKYPAPYSAVVNPIAYRGAEKSETSIFKAKPFKPPKCYLDTEAEVVSWVTSGLNDWQRVSKEFKCAKEWEHYKTKHKSLDASIMEIADDIAYGVHDLEDAIKLKFIDQRAFKKEVSQQDLTSFCCWSDDSGNKTNYEKLVTMLFSESSYERKKAIGELVDFCVSNTKLDKTNPYDFFNPIFGYQAVFLNDVKTVLDKLMKLVKKKVIFSTNVQQLELKGQKIVTELFNAFATNPTRLLPSEDVELLDEVSGDTSHERRVICDYIAGMTDEYAIKRYQQLFQPREGSVFDRL